MLALALKMKRIKERNNDKERNVYTKYISRKREKSRQRNITKPPTRNVFIFMNCNLSPDQ